MQSVLLSPCTRGTYYLSPPDLPEDAFYRPFVQVGQQVEVGQPLCRIIEQHLRKKEQYVVLSPVKGVVLERLLEAKHVVTTNGLLTLKEGFTVRFGEPLFLLRLTP